MAARSMELLILVMGSSTEHSISWSLSKAINTGHSAFRSREISIRSELLESVPDVTMRASLPRKTTPRAPRGAHIERKEMHLNDPTLDAEVTAFREFLKTKIEPMARTVRIYRTPSATRVYVSPYGEYVNRCDIVRFRAIVRDIGYYLGCYRREHYAACFAAMLIDNNLDEASALVASCLDYHDDRGDGLLWVPAFRNKAVREAWKRATSALGIETKTRPCMR